MATTLKMVMITYNEAMDMEIMEVMERCALKNYTKILGAFGKGTTSGTHLGTDVWPGHNNILYIACQEAETKELMRRIKELREQFGAEGVKAFILPIEEITS
jgi:hypothetical protein